MQKSALKKLDFLYNFTFHGMRAGREHAHGHGHFSAFAAPLISASCQLTHFAHSKLRRKSTYLFLYWNFSQFQYKIA